VIDESLVTSCGTCHSFNNWDHVVSSCWRPGSGCLYNREFQIFSMKLHLSSDMPGPSRAPVYRPVRIRRATDPVAAGVLLIDFRHDVNWKERD